jgi:hypothetical protein
MTMYLGFIATIYAFRQKRKAKDDFEMRVFFSKIKDKISVRFFKCDFRQKHSANGRQGNLFFKI